MQERTTDMTRGAGKNRQTAFFQLAAFLAAEDALPDGARLPMEYLRDDAQHTGEVFSTDVSMRETVHTEGKTKHAVRETPGQAASALPVTADLLRSVQGVARNKKKASKAAENSLVLQAQKDIAKGFSPVVNTHAADTTVAATYKAATAHNPGITGKATSAATRHALSSTSVSAAAVPVQEAARVGTLPPVVVDNTRFLTMLASPTEGSGQADVIQETVREALLQAGVSINQSVETRELFTQEDENQEELFERFCGWMKKRTQAEMDTAFADFRDL